MKRMNSKESAKICLKPTKASLMILNKSKDPTKMAKKSTTKLSKSWRSSSKLLLEWILYEMDIYSISQRILFSFSSLKFTKKQLFQSSGQVSLSTRLSLHRISLLCNLPVRHFVVFQWAMRFRVYKHAASYFKSQL